MYTHIDTIAVKNIIEYLSKPNVYQMNDLIEVFNELPNEEFGHLYPENQTLMHILIRLNLDYISSLYGTEIDFTHLLDVVDILLLRAITDPDLFSFLLTTVNEEQRTPFYEAFGYQGYQQMAPKISYWTIYGVQNGLIKHTDYAQIHLIKNKHGDRPLTECIKNVGFEMALGEIKFAVDNGWIPYPSFVNILTEPNNDIRLVDTAFESGCYETIDTLINHAGYLAFRECSFRKSALDILARSGKSKALDISLKVIQDRVFAGKMSRDIYENIFLKIMPGKRANRILDLGFFPGSGAARVMIEHAESANLMGLLSDEAYKTLLLNHPNRKEGYSQAYEAARCTDYRATYAYMNACLWAIINKIITLESFQHSLYQTHLQKFNVLYFAINNPSFEIAALFINIFRSLMPQEIYLDLLMKQHKTGTYKLRCEANQNQPNFQSIHALIENERNIFIRGVHEVSIENSYVGSNSPERRPKELLETLNLIDRVKQDFLVPRQPITRLPPIITQTLEITPPLEVTTPSSLDSDDTTVVFPQSPRFFSRVIAPPKKNPSASLERPTPNSFDS